MDFSLNFFAPRVMRASESSRMVRTITLDGHGHVNKIKVKDAPLPERIKEDHVEVDVYYCGMNFTDNYLRLGVIRNVDFPVIMGSECSGVVTGAGKRVTDLQVGQRVLCLKMQGGLFRHVVHVPRQNCFLVPDDISLKDAVGLGIHFLTAYLCLFEYGCLKSSQTIFMHSIGGGVGTAVIQLARTVPLVKILGSTSYNKHNKVLALGAAHVFYVEEDYQRRLLKLYPDGADLVINCYGGSAVDACLDVLKSCGKLINLGSNNSAIYPRTPLWRFLTPQWDSKMLSSGEMTSHNYSVTGLNIGYLLEKDSNKIQSIMNRIFQMRSMRKIRPCVHAFLSFDKVTEGMRQLCRRENIGKVVLVVKEEVDPPAANSSESSDSDDTIQLDPRDKNTKNGEVKDEDETAENTDIEIEEAEEVLEIVVAEKAGFFH